jgi:hypothetical protein
MSDRWHPYPEPLANTFDEPEHAVHLGRDRALADLELTAKEAGAVKGGIVTNNKDPDAFLPEVGDEVLVAFDHRGSGTSTSRN